MITFEQARAIAGAAIREGEVRDGGMIWIVDDTVTVEREWGWAFGYNAKQYLETGDLRYGLLGNVPIAVERFDGSVHHTGAGGTIEECVAPYEARRARRLAGLPEVPARSLPWRMANWFFERLGRLSDRKR